MKAVLGFSARDAVEMCTPASRATSFKVDRIDDTGREAIRCAGGRGGFCGPEVRCCLRCPAKDPILQTIAAEPIATEPLRRHPCLGGMLR